jgi:4-alpha-glucanotransferase
MRDAGALRIDHAMALQRLFVIPKGADGRGGTYLSYPFEAMTGILALESRRRGCLVIGEDLGSVPEGFRETMAARAILAYKVLPFERVHDGNLLAPAHYPYLSLAMAATHDLPTLAGWWLGRDIEVRAALGLLPPEAVPAARHDRIVERYRLLAVLDQQRLAPDPRPDPETGDSVPDSLLDAIHLLLARAGSALALAQLADILAETEAVNLPGTWTEYPNWRRKLTLDLDDPEFRRRFERTAALFRSARPRVA